MRRISGEQSTNTINICMTRRQTYWRRGREKEKGRLRRN